MINLIMLSVDPISEVGGYTIASVGYIIVFIALVILICVFSALPKVINYYAHKKYSSNNPQKKLVSQKSNNELDANVTAAIAMGLHLYFSDQHDNESNIITIESATKQYSPWNSKIYGVMNVPPVKK